MTRLDHEGSSGLMTETMGGFDRRTILLSGAAGGAAFLPLLVVGAPPILMAPIPVLCGVLAGATSDNYGGEWMDGGAAAVVNLLVNYVVVLGFLWVRTMGIDPVARSNVLVFTGTMLGVVIVLFLIPVMGVGGALGGLAGARIQHG
jgi:hypothetical protein